MLSRLPASMISSCFASELRQRAFSNYDLLKSGGRIATCRKKLAFNRLKRVKSGGEGILVC